MIFFSFFFCLHDEMLFSEVDKPSQEK